MKKDTENKVETQSFYKNLPDDFIFPRDAVGQRLLKEYGATFAARGKAIPPNMLIFKNEAEVSAFQTNLPKSVENIGGFEVELQSPAMENLRIAIVEATQNNLTITPRGADAAKRIYAETVALWASRVNPGLAYWLKAGKLTEAAVIKIQKLSPFEQVSEIFKLESQGIFFSKDFSKSIIYSVAPPGTSQHLSMLALDVAEHTDSKVRDVLAKHGWFQTVVSDLPHFTFLGVSENQLSGFGLKKVNNGGRDYWLPNI